MSNLRPTPPRRQGPQGESRGPVGRPSVRDQRRREILDAATQVILDHGIAGATRTRIAERAGVRPPAVHHFVGTQAEVLAATIEHIGERLIDAVTPDPPAAADPMASALATIDAAFGAAVDQPSVNRLTDELIAHSYRDDVAREALAQVYRRATDYLMAAFELAWDPESSTDARAAAAEVVALAHAAGTFRHLGLTEQASVAHARARELVTGTAAPS